MSKDFEIRCFYHLCLFLDVFSTQEGGGGRHDMKEMSVYPLV
jgi:hypothetical protein